MTNTSNTQSHISYLNAYIIARTFLGILLLTAAILKTHQLATEPIIERDFFSKSWVLIGQVNFEVMLGITLLAGLFRRLVWAISLAAFAAFACITLYQALSGELSCGCFGTVEVNPWYTFILDLACIAAILLFRPKKRINKTDVHVKWRVPIFAGSVVMTTALLILANIMIASYSPATLGDDGQIIGDDQFVLIEPSDWVGKSFALSRHINVGEQLMQGHWTVILYYRNCPHCQEVLPKFVTQAQQRAKQGNISRIAFIQIPQDGKTGPCPVETGPECTLGLMNNARDWSVPSPAVFCIIDGKVISATSEQTEVQIVKLPKARPAATIAIEGSQGEHDFGYVEPNSAHRVTFTITNNSSSAIAVNKVRSECVCMSIPIELKTLKPGTTNIPVDFIAPKHPINYSQRISIQTKGQALGTITIRIIADVGRPIILKNPKLNFGLVAQNQQITKYITIVNRGKKTITPTYATSTTPACWAKIPKTTILPGKELSVPITLNTKNLPPQKYQAKLTIHSDKPPLTAKIEYTIVSKDKE